MPEIVGLHINKLENNPNNRHSDHMAALNSTWHTMLDPETGQVAEVKARSPHTKVLARPYVRDQDYHALYLQGNPQEAGQWAASMALSQRGRNPQADAWIVLNEPPCDTIEQVTRLAQADIAYMKVLEAQGAKAGIGAFSTGNIQLPSIDGGAAVRAYEPAFRYAAANGHYLVIHCYAASRPMMGGVTPSGWVHNPRYYGLRWHEEIFPYMRSKGIPIPKVIVSEFGLDLGFAKTDGGYTGQYVGYRVAPDWGYGESEAGARQYVDELMPFATELAKDAEVQGLCIYCAGDNGDERWKSFMVDWVLPYLAAKTFPSPTTTTPPQPQPTPPPPTGGFMIDRRYMGRAGIGENYEPRPAGVGVDGVILHHTGGGFLGSLNHLTSATSGVGAHYLIDYDGKIYQLIEDTYAAWHAGYSILNGREDCNRYTLGVEIVNAGDGREPYPQIQQDALVWLLKEKAREHQIPRMWVDTHQKVRANYKAKYPTATNPDGSPISHKTDPRGLDVSAILNRVYGTPDNPPPPLPYTDEERAKAKWFTEQLARTLRGDTDATATLISALISEPKKAGLHNAIVTLALKSF